MSLVGPGCPHAKDPNSQIRPLRPWSRELLGLVVNAVLYTTCDDYRFEVRAPAPPGVRGSGPPSPGPLISVFSHSSTLPLLRSLLGLDLALPEVEAGSGK